MQIVVGRITVAELFGTEGFLEFDSMINLRPGQGNRTRSVEDPGIRAAIAELVGRVVVP
ncbi:MAG TPA: DUF5674 family protein [Patescibacteria group bacterium]|nr:DUF5674 family protein [Patescibacteria group bacterium]